MKEEVHMIVDQPKPKSEYEEAKNFYAECCKNRDSTGLSACLQFAALVCWCLFLIALFPDFYQYENWDEPRKVFSALFTGLGLYVVLGFLLKAMEAVAWSIESNSALRKCLRFYLLDKGYLVEHLRIGAAPLSRDGRNGKIHLIKSAHLVKTTGNPIEHIHLHDKPYSVSPDGSIMLTIDEG